jgi:hypothetical protein
MLVIIPRFVHKIIVVIPYLIHEDISIWRDDLDVFGSEPYDKYWAAI